MVAKFTNQPTNKEVVSKINDVINDMGTVKSVNSTSPDSNGNVSLTIPTVNNATLTIQKNGTTVKTFTANASSNVTCNITVPTNTNELTNGAGFVTTDTKNTAGSTDTSSKIFLVGATSQAANPQTYSHDTAFVDTSGQLNSANPSSSTNSTVVATTKWVTDKGYTTNTGTITGIKMNGASKGTSGVVDLGTVITDISGKQDTLVSGTNIKTINNESILGSGNISISTGGTVDQTYNGTSANAQSGVAIAGAGFLTSHQDISGKANTDLGNLSANGKLVLDGQPTSLDQAIITSATSLNGSSDLGAYTVNVPNNGQKYELLLQCQVTSTATVGQWLILRLHSSIHWLDVFQVVSPRAATQDWTVSCKIYIDSDRKFWISRSTSWNGSIKGLKVMSYRRIGTNS